MQLTGRLCAVTICLAASVVAQAQSVAKLTEAQRKELATFGMRAMGLKVSPRDIEKTPNGAETSELIATGLNLNGHLCAKVASVAPLKVKGGYEVVCIANRGGSARKSYVVDALEGRATEL